MEYNTLKPQHLQLRCLSFLFVQRVNILIFASGRTSCSIAASLPMAPTTVEQQSGAMTTDNTAKCIPLSASNLTSAECIEMCSKTTSKDGTTATKCENGGGCVTTTKKDDDECFSDSQHCVELCYPSSPAPLPADTPPSELLEITRKLFAEALGTGLLVMIVVGSGISGESLSDDVGVQLLINSVATMAGLYGLITILGPVSGAHFNPVVSMVDCMYNDMSPSNLCLYALSQIGGGIIGCIVANVQYDIIPLEFSMKERFGYELWISEVIATASLLFVIHGCIRTGQEASVPLVVSAWVGGGYFFTSSSIFANPAVTIGRMFTNTFAGIEPTSVPVYICFQILGGLIGYGLVRFFYPHKMQPLKNDDVLYKRACVLVNKDFFIKETY